MGVDESIADFVTSFWPLDMSFETQEVLPWEEYKKELLERYDPAIIERIEALIHQRDRRLHRDEGVEEYREITDIIFQHRMHEHFYPGAALGSRTALALLIQYFQNSQTPETILDLGCGTGMVPIGLLKRFPTLQQAYAVDISAHALEITRENAERKIPERARAITCLHKDYTTQEFKEEMKQHSPKGTKHITITFPMGGVSEVFRNVPQLLHPEGEILFATTIHDDELGKKLPWEEIIIQLRYQHGPEAYHRGLHLEEGILYEPVRGNHCIVLSRIRHAQ